MKMPIRKVNRYVWGVLLAFVLISCGSSSSIFSEQAYQQAVSLKVESLALMDQATGPFTTHSQEVMALNKELQKAHTYAQGRPNNDVTTRQWEILMDPDRNLLGGFLNRWEQEGTLSPAFVEDAKGLVSDAFDTIIQLESGKIKRSEME